MQLKIGVLVIGSLDWESKDYGGDCAELLKGCGRELRPNRVAWREQRLMSEAAYEFRVRTPIRYGRRSRSRNQTYTMVFSPEYEQRQGTAKIIQCKQTVSSIDDLLEEALALWVAEDSEDNRGEISANWGCVTLLIPGGFLDSPERVKRQGPLDAWATEVSKRKSYGALRFSEKDQEAAKGSVIVGGRLRISWPALVGGGPVPCDLLLATATNPNLRPGQTYPTAEEIAGAWNRNGHVYYFRCNRLTGIQTSDDDEIGVLLT